MLLSTAAVDHCCSRRHCRQPLLLTAIAATVVVSQNCQHILLYTFSMVLVEHASGGNDSGGNDSDNVQSFNPQGEADFLFRQNPPL